MKELDFNTENSVKVVKAMGRGLVTECARDVLCSKIIGKQPDTLIEGMAKAASLFVDILTKETEFRDALKLLSEQGVIIE
jgi:hypothetical protein